MVVLALEQCVLTLYKNRWWKSAFTNLLDFLEYVVENQLLMGTPKVRLVTVMPLIVRISVVHFSVGAAQVRLASASALQI